MQKYYATEGWDSPASDAANYLAGSMYEEDDYTGGNATSSALIKQTINVYAGTNGTHTSCASGYNTQHYAVCEVILLNSKTTTYEQTGSSNANAPWVQSTDTYDDYSSSSGIISGFYHNKLTEVTTSSNTPTKTQSWTYATTNTTVGSTVYYNVHSATHTQLADASGHVWSCSDTIYDEGNTTGLSTPVAGWVTTAKTYTTCGTSSSATTTYTAYDAYGNAVATVDGIGVANPGLYASSGCTPSTTDPVVYKAAAWTAPNYTSCTTYDLTSGLTLTGTNAFKQATSATYDTTQGLLMTSSTDVNGLVTTQSESVDSSGNVTTVVKDPGATGTYSVQGTLKSTCTDTSTLPCLEVDSNNALYSGAVTRVFYDQMGRKVETLTPGPDADHTTVTFTVNYDSTNASFTSQPFVVAARTTFLDPNGAVDDAGVTPEGTAVTMDALGRILTSTDALGQVSTTVYGLGTTPGSGDSKTYELTTAIDGNRHVQLTYTDGASNHVYVVDDSGLSGGTLTANRLASFVYNVLGKPISVTATDLTPKSGQSLTSVATTATYDDLGRMITLVDPDRGTHSYTYDANGHMLSDTSGGRVAGTSYDLLGRAGCTQNAAPTSISVTGACSSGATPYTVDTYDATPGGDTTNNIGRLTQAVTYTYYQAPDNATGTVTESMSYDVRGHLTSKSLQLAVSGTGITFPTLPTYTQTLSYNDADQLVTTTVSAGGTTDYTFTNVYDGTTGVLSGLTNGSTSLATLTYNARNAVAAVTLKDSTGAGLASEAFTYDKDLRVIGASTTWISSGNTIYSDSVSYDAAGNVVSRATTQAAIPNISGSGGSEIANFCYDEQNRMVWASNVTPAALGPGQTCGSAPLSSTLGGGYTTSYIFTHLGQIWQGALGGGAIQEQYLYCAAGHPHEVTALSPTSGNPTCAAPGTTDYSAGYDSFGNLTSRTYPATTTGQPVYSAQDQMVTWRGTTPAASNGEWYLYDSTGARVLRRSASTTAGNNPATASATITVYAFGLAEHQYTYSGSGTSATATTTTCYYSLNSKLLGTLSKTSSGSVTTTYLLTDTVGSVVSAISNTAGSAAVLGNQVYGPFGNKRYSAGSVGTDKGFTGQYADSLTGFDYYMARYYDPISARFLQADTVQGNLQAMDPYDYVGGNPETRTDPTGRCWPVCTMLIGAAIGAAVGAGISIGSQVVSGHSVNWGEVGKQAVVGAVSGAVSGLAGPEAGVLAQAAIGAASSAAGQAVSNVIDHKPIGDGVAQAAAIGGVTGGLAAAAGPLVQKAGSAIVSKVGNVLGSAATDSVETAASTTAQDTEKFLQARPVASPLGRILPLQRPTVKCPSVRSR